MITDLPPNAVGSTSPKMRDYLRHEVDTSDLEAESRRLEIEKVIHLGRVLEALTREPVGPQPTTIPIKIHGVWHGRGDAVRSGRERLNE